MNINERFTKILEYSEFSASEFSDEIDVQRSSISHILSGRNRPSLEFIVKIKNRFPELSWDWMILGNGDMIQRDNTSPTSFEFDKNSNEEIAPDLFSLIDEDYKNEIFIQENIKNEALRDSPISFPVPRKDKISDSQQLDIQENNSAPQNIVNKFVNNITSENKIKRIVLFYDNGKFEAFEP